MRRLKVRRSPKKEVKVAAEGIRVNATKITSQDTRAAHVAPRKVKRMTKKNLSSPLLMMNTALDSGVAPKRKRLRSLSRLSFLLCLLHF